MLRRHNKTEHYVLAQNMEKHITWNKYHLVSYQKIICLCDLDLFEFWKNICRIIILKAAILAAMIAAILNLCIPNQRM